MGHLRGCLPPGALVNHMKVPVSLAIELVHLHEANIYLPVELVGNTLAACVAGAWFAQFPAN